MDSIKKQDTCTRERLLKSACEVFANKGYRDATIADISERAGTNIAAVNYHFGDKKTLYVEAWRLAFHKSLEDYPPDGGISPTAPAEERLRGRISAAIQRFAGSRYVFEIISKELAAPTGLLEEVMRESVEPLRREFGSIVRELLGEHASQQQIELCRMSIMSQCFNMTIQEQCKKALAKAAGKTNLPPDNFNFESMAEHITRFSLAGIREIRRQTETGELPDQNNMAITGSPKNFKMRC